MMRLSIRWKWLLAQVLIGSAVLLFMVIYLKSQLMRDFEDRFENRWQQELKLVKLYVESSDFATLGQESADRLADELGEILEARVTIMDSLGWVIGDSQVDLQDISAVENHKDRPEVIAARAGQIGQSRRRSTTVDVDLVYFAEQVGNGNLGVVRIGVPMVEVEEARAQIMNLIWLTSALGFALVALIGLYASRTMTRRLEEMTQAAQTIACGDFSQKIVPKSNDELTDLGFALNHMVNDCENYISQITRERDELQTILNSMVEGVMVTDLSGKILLINQSLRNMFDLPATVVKSDAIEVFRDSELLTALERAWKKKESMVVTIEVINPNRKTLEVHIGVLGSKTKPTGTVLVFHEITRLKQLENIRRDFVANVSHELRSPLTAIKGYVETILENGKLQRNKSEEFLQIILRHADRMSKLVDDLLMLSKLESVESDVATTEIDLRDLLLHVADQFRNLLEKEKIELRLSIPNQLPKIRGSVTEIETVFENLIDNAIKYGARGKLLEITASELMSEVQVAVADHGMGIPVDDQPRIFERFYRVDKGRSRSLGGTGLGLSIVKHIVQRHGGRVWVESELGNGARFCVAFPQNQSVVGSRSSLVGN
jgi:two-component system phosphate regulon sensor histidine kinase PhoR